NHPAPRNVKKDVQIFLRLKAGSNPDLNNAFPQGTFQSGHFKHTVDTETDSSDNILVQDFPDIHPALMERPAFTHNILVTDRGNKEPSAGGNKEPSMDVDTTSFTYPSNTNSVNLSSQSSGIKVSEPTIRAFVQELVDTLHPKLP